MRRGLRVGRDHLGARDWVSPSRGRTPNRLFLTPNTETTYGTTFARPEGLGADGYRGAAAVAVCGRRLLVSLRRRHGDRRTGQGRRAASTCSCRPGYDGEVPDGYFVYRSPTFTNWAVFRALGGVPAIKQTKVYPLRRRRSPTENEFINIAEFVFNTVHANDFTFYEELDELVQEEPVEALDAERAGQLAAIGIVKGQPFAPDDRMRDILEQAARIGAGIARTIAYSPARSRRGALRLLEELLRRRQLRVPGTVRDCGCPHPVSLPRDRRHPGDGPRPGRRRLGLRLHRARHQRRPARRRPRPTGCMSTLTRRPRPSGPSTSTTPRPGR